MKKMDDNILDLVKILGWGWLGQKLGVPVRKIEAFVQNNAKAQQQLEYEIKLLKDKLSMSPSEKYIMDAYSIQNQRSANSAHIEKLLASLFKKPISQKSTPQNITFSNKWLDIMPENIRCVIIGGSGAGKSAAGFMLLELYRWKMHPYVLGFPEVKKLLLPEWIGLAETFDNIPPNSIILVDEAYLLYHSRKSGFDKTTQEMVQEIGLARQRRHNIIFIAHEARHLDKNIVGYANLFIIKNPGTMQTVFERKEVSGLLERAKEASRHIEDNVKKWAYIYSPEKDFEGQLETPLPSFWTPELSHAYAGGIPISCGRTPKKTSKEDEKAQAIRMREAGWSIGDIAKALGKSKGTIHNWLTKGG